MKRKYEVFAALYEDSNEGWIWMPGEKDFDSRDHITVKSIATGKKVTCVCRIIDDNYIIQYNQPPRRIIANPKEAIVLSTYYRDKLADRAKSKEIKTSNIYEFEIKKVWRFNYFRKILALVQHPDNAIKIATWLAIISIIIGLLGLLGFNRLLSIK